MVKKIVFQDEPHDTDPSIKNIPKQIWWGATDAFEKWQTDNRDCRIISIKDSGWLGLKMEVWYDSDTYELNARR